MSTMLTLCRWLAVGAAGVVGFSTLMFFVFRLVDLTTNLLERLFGPRR